ncbi:hypothetical protein HC028_04370 [Planosporangium flavigriseum]|uniref:Uncharacterized protein n=1 Tax=Planosporangium flavigriseum TaxID=373681 RepID=A0A8J3PLZ2_9ACTN|nr:hypothetical protein [Planosporangium flavigriseum]NJC63745.1 hypothetical protein [Planosporangium flavigriseum]GIG73759.1 hypothetical protein Pfl04_21630 [Planosporangium flavigriseum]
MRRIRAADPATEAWANIRAINTVCRRIITASNQVVISAYAGTAGAGGEILGLGADIVLARDGVVPNPYCKMGLFGSELHTYTLPLRVGADRGPAHRRVASGRRGPGAVDRPG